MRHVALAMAFAVTAVGCSKGTGNSGTSTGASTNATAATPTPPDCNTDWLPDPSEIATHLPANFGTPDSNTVNGVGLILYPVQNVSSVSYTCFNQKKGRVVAKIRYAKDGQTSTIWNNFARGDSAYLYVAPVVKGEQLADLPGGKLFRYEIRKVNGAGHPSKTVWSGHAFWYSDTDQSHKDRAVWGQPAHYGNPWAAQYQEVEALGPAMAAARKLSAQHRIRADSADTTKHDGDGSGGAWFSCDQGCCNVTGLF